MAAYAVAMGAVLALCADWTARQTWAVILTGVVLIWYTWETMMLRRAAFLQRETQIRPYVVFYADKGAYSVENVGSGPALGVTVDTVEFRADEHHLAIHFPTQVPLLRPGQVAPIIPVPYLNGKQLETEFAAHLDPRYAVEPLAVHIRFRSVEGRSYHVVEEVAHESLEILGLRDESAA